MTVCLGLLSNRYPAMTDVEKKLADYILTHQEETVVATIASLAQASGVSPATVHRFCKGLGFSGFPHFKRALAVEVSRAGNHQDVFSSLKRDDSSLTVLEKVFATSIRTLQDTLAMINPEVLKKAIEMLDHCNQMLFVGVGTSSTIAIDAQYRMMQLGYRAAVSTDVLYMRVAAMNMRPGDVIIGISHSGATKDTVEALRIAKKNGVSTIAITSFIDGPICQYTDCLLQVFSDDSSYPVEAVSARVAHICLLDAIAMALSHLHYEEAKEHIEMRNQAFRDIRQ